MPTSPDLVAIAERVARLIRRSQERARTSLQVVRGFRHRMQRRKIVPIWQSPNAEQLMPGHRDWLMIRRYLDERHRGAAATWTQKV
jgi:hypothetical protein